MQRILIGLAVIVVVLGVGIGVYYGFFAGGGNVTVTPQGGGSLPISDDATSTPGGGGAQGPIDLGQPTQVAQRLIQISKGPVASGIVALEATSTNSDLVVKFVARESGNVYEYTKAQSSLVRTSNKTIPGIQEAVWRPDGSLAYVRYLSGEGDSVINTYALPSLGEGGYFLPQGIQHIATNISSILYIVSGANGSVATMARPDGSQQKQVFVSPLAELVVDYLGSNYLAYTKPAGGISGYAYVVNSTGLFERVEGPLGGLVANPSPSGKWLLISHTSGGTMQLRLLNVTTHESIALPLGTVADKCTWSKDDSTIYCGVPVNPPADYTYPDDWYQGAVSFSDRIWRIDVGGKFAELVLDFSKEAGQQLDMVSPTIDSKGTHLVFKNKRDGSLWLYEL